MSRLVRSTVLSFALIVSATSIGAQAPVIQPGDARLRVANIRTGTDSFRIESRFRGVALTTTLIRTVNRGRDEGRDVLVFAQLYRTQNGNTTDTSWVDATTLAPLRYVADVYGELQAFRFDGGTATGTVTPRNAPSRPVSVNAPTAFFNAVALDFVYVALPWAKGLAVNIPLYKPPRAPFDLALRVTGEEKLALLTGGTITAWKVDYQLGSNVQTVWLDKRTGEFLKIGGRQGPDYYFKYRADLEPPLLR